MDTSSNFVSVSSIKDLVKADDVSKVANIVALDPEWVLNNPSLIKNARTPQMVETLLLLDNETNGSRKKSRIGNPEEFEELIEVADKAHGSLEDKEKRSCSDISMKVIRRDLKTVLERWPLTILKIFDNQVKYKGLCKEDPEIEVDMDFSVLNSEINPDHCCSVMKPDLFIHLSQLDVTEPESKRILLHPIVLAYLHTYSKSEWKMTFLKLLLLIVGVIALLTDNVAEKLQPVCGKIIGEATDDTPWANTSFFYLSLFFLLFLLHTFLEIPKVLFLHKNHWKEFSLQLIVFLFVPFSFIGSEHANSLFSTIFTLILLLNLLESLSSNILCGKYILLSFGVLQTLLKTVFPILLLMMAMAATDFTLRHDEMTDDQIHAVWSDETAEAEEACLTLSPLQGDLGWLELGYFFRSILQVLSIMYGSIDTSYLTSDYKLLRDPSSEVVPSYTIHWLLTTTLATLILMNLLVGLTIGDVRTIDENADCLIVQIELKKLYRTIMRRNLRCCFFKCFGFVCRTKKPSNKVKTFYPNKSKKSCVVAGKKNTCGVISPMVSQQFILGCRRLRKTIFERYN